MGLDFTVISESVNQLDRLVFNIQVKTVFLKNWITSRLPVIQYPASVFFPTVQNLPSATPSDFTFPHKASLSA
jgi:hypothetical protein